jgi:hypothetical protein
MQNEEITSNPLGSVDFRTQQGSANERPKVDVAKKPDPNDSEADLARDLGQAAQRKPPTSDSLENQP